MSLTEEQQAKLAKVQLEPSWNMPKWALLSPRMDELKDFSATTNSNRIK